MIIDSFMGIQHSSIFINRRHRSSIMKPEDFGASHCQQKDPKDSSSQPETPCLCSQLESPRMRPHSAVRGKKRQAHPSLESLKQENLEFETSLGIASKGPLREGR